MYKLVGRAAYTQAANAWLIDAKTWISEDGETFFIDSRFCPQIGYHYSVEKVDGLSLGAVEWWPSRQLIELGPDDYGLVTGYERPREHDVVFVVLCSQGEIEVPTDDYHYDDGAWRLYRDEEEDWL